MDWKDRLGAMKSDLPEGEEKIEELSLVKPRKQVEPLRVEMEKRNGKPSTLITEFQGSEEELKELAKMLKQKCSSGGSARGGEILIQGDFRVKVAEILIAEGFKVKKINFK